MATHIVEPAEGGVAAAVEHLTIEDRIWLLRAMLLMRGLEERAMTLYRQGKGGMANKYADKLYKEIKKYL